MTPFFSIIIPVYNVAPYLRECLDSVLSQTFTDWEALCVDDGSTDGSGTILDEYAAKDKRFRVIHQKNAGVSAARNVGLANAEGEWFLYLDGDDVLRMDALGTFLTYVGGTSSFDGILVQPFIPHWNGQDIPAKKVVTQVLVEKASKKDLFLGPYAANGFPFSRVYRRSVFGQLRFRCDIAMAEDVCFWFDALCLDARWLILRAEYYLYRQRPDSACGIKNPHRCTQALDAVIHALRDIGSRIDPSGESRLKYLRRFPYTVVYNLNLAIARYNELSCNERIRIKEQVAEIIGEAGCWPFGMWLKMKLWIVAEGKWLALLPSVMFCERSYLLARRIVGALCRKMGLR